MSESNQEEEEFSLDPSDIVEVIDLDDNADSRNYSDESDDGGEDEEGDEGDNEMDAEEASGPLQDDSQYSFTGHTNSEVICTRLNPVNSQLAVTGGQDDQAFVWNTLDGSILFRCAGHTDTVVSVGFSHLGTMVATADMKGLIKVWAVDSGAEIWSFEASEIEWVQWHHSAPVLLAGTKDGHLWMWKVPSGDCKTFTGYGPGAVCGRIMPDGKRAYAGYGDGVLKIWDLKSAEVIHTVTGYDGHKESIFCVDHNDDSSLIMSGSGDLTAKIINPMSGKIVTTFPCKSSDEEEDSVETVGFSHTHNYAATGTLGGNLEIWDLPTKSVRHCCDHSCGIVKLAWSPNSPMLYTAGLDGCMRQFDSRDGQLTKVWQGHTAAILDFDIDRQESIMVTASDDGTAKVFSLQSGKR